MIYQFSGWNAEQLSQPERLEKDGEPQHVAAKAGVAKISRLCAEQMDLSMKVRLLPEGGHNYPVAEIERKNRSKAGYVLLSDRS